jgi:carbon-monoxide dehydrogenase small subunit
MAKPTQRQKTPKKPAKPAAKPTKKPVAKKPAKKPVAKKPAKKPVAKTPAKKPVAKPAKKPAKKPVAKPTAKPAPPVDRTVRLTVNGRVHALEPGRDVEPHMTLAFVLREKLGYTGLKLSCDEGACGACTVLMDGRAVLSCMTLAVEAHGHELLTIEGLAKDDPVVEAFAAQCEPGHGTALQCGYCTPGFVMTSVALLRENPRPTLDDVKEGLSGNLCRCGCYAGIAKAVLHASDTLSARGGAR